MLLSSRFVVRAIQRQGVRTLSVSATSDVSAGIFPAGRKQAKVQLPAIFVCVSSQEALMPGLAEHVDACIQAGATALVVRDSATGGADLFKATAQLKDVVRGRVAVLLEDRTDIVAATQADGVVLTQQGAPIRLRSQLGAAELARQRNSTFDAMHNRRFPPSACC
jgi:Thiamine monophosphate synthase